MIKLLIGGSPCTYWSCAQKNNRETEPSGLGWELFENYLIAKEKFTPDFFLYENNKSAAQAIKDEIKKQFGVWDGTFLTEDTGARYIEINSALVSAQNRQRFYVHNCGDVEQPGDRGILLRDVLESGVVDREKAYCLKHQAGNARDFFKKHHTNIALEPIRIPDYAIDKSRPLTASYKNKGNGEGSLASECFPDNPNKQVFDYVAEPVNTTADGKAKALRASADKDGIRNFVGNEKDKRTCVAEPVCVNSKIDGVQPSLQDRIYSPDGKSTPVTTSYMPKIAEPVRVGDMGSKAQAHRIYSVDGKSVCINSGDGGLGAKTGLYAIPVYYGAEAVEFDENGKPTKARSYADGKTYPVYEVRDGMITIKGKQYPIKLKDGYYIIRKLTVTECCRLQGMPDWWFLDKDGNKILSDTQAYKGLGNGWQLDTVKYILEHGLRNIPRNEELVVLSLYDGIATGRRILEELGFTNVKYYAYEIDKHCVKLTSYRYPDIIHCGDAFKVRNKGEIEKII